MRKNITKIICLLVVCAMMCVGITYTNVQAMENNENKIEIESGFYVETDNQDCYTLGTLGSQNERKLFTLHDGAALTFSGSADNWVIVVEENANVTITLNNFSLTKSNNWGWNNDQGIELKTGATASIIIPEDTASLITGGCEASSIRVPDGADLMISGGGKLDVKINNSSSAAVSSVIGGMYNGSYGNILIKDCEVDLNNRNLGVGRWKAEDQTANHSNIILINATLKNANSIGTPYPNNSSYNNIIIQNSDIGNTTINGNTMIIENDAEGNLTGTTSSDFTLFTDYTIPEGAVVTVPENGRLTVSGEGELTVSEGGTLNFAPGSVLRLEDGATFIMNGKLTGEINIERLGHNYAQWEVTTEPTENTEGVLTRTCQNDSNHTETLTLPTFNKTDYTYTVTNEPACEQDGEGEYLITIDGQIFEFKVTLPKTNHSFGQWEVTTESTENTEGVLTRTCQNDSSHTETVTLPALNKTDYTYTVTNEPTCEQDGEGEYSISVDGQTFEFKVTLPKTDHNFGQWEVTTEPTENTDGVLTRTCQNDSSHTETMILPALNETDYTYTVTNEPTCEQDGEGEYLISVDSQTFEFKVNLPKTDHSYSSDWISDETNHWNACVCGEKLNEAAHTFQWIIDKEATATEEGSKHEECTVCGYKKASVEIPAAGSSSSEPISSDESDSKAPQTGDSNNMTSWIMLLSVLGFGLFGATAYSIKKKYNQ